MKFSLVVGQGPHKGRVIPVSLPQFIIGRDSKCHLRPASQTISKRHCELLTRDDRWFVRDLSSTNGTFVNEDQVTGEHELRDGDLLKVGPLDFGVRIEVQAEKPTEVDKDTKAPQPTPAFAEPPRKEPDVLDEEAVGSMLLEMTEEEKTQAEAGEMEGSTIMDVVKQPGEDGTATKPGPYRPPSQKQQTPASTSSAAKAILEKYRRRPRS